MRKDKPVITHTEILTRAMNNLEQEINDWRKRGEGCESMVGSVVAPLEQKLEALHSLYEIETGTQP